ncbi:MAG: molecular chaperone DnaK, partial [Lachnospiraceae bacterium]|nr:molecular chaperone DnaK [Lachnospiraceae bacterium]
LDAGLKAQVDEDLAHLKDLVAKTNPEVMSDGEIEDIKAAKEKLMNSAQQLFSKMYEQAQAANQAQGQDMGGSAPKDDNVVDGEYREV